MGLPLGSHLRVDLAFDLLFQNVCSLQPAVRVHTDVGCKQCVASRQPRAELSRSWLTQASHTVGLGPHNSGGLQQFKVEHNQLNGAQ